MLVLILFEVLFNGLFLLLVLVLGCFVVDGILFWIFLLFVLLIDGVFKLFGVLVLFVLDVGVIVIEWVGIVVYFVCWVSVLN